ncbi:MAG: helix-turn-helix domain-containing protein [Ruminococcaceae bacterium]|nr:helix-turn-helix domain-containing protein [Oscillospiraceae bacterium]
MSHYVGSRLKTDIAITKLYTVHYFEYPKNFKFTGESHNFWELVYTDKGTITVFSDDKSYTLKQGNIVFHKPNEWHNIHSDSKEATNVAIVSFECMSPAMKYFENKILSAGQDQKTIMSKIISEYTGAFSTPLDNPYTNHLVRKQNPTIGSEQLIRQYIAELLISFLRDVSPIHQRSQMSINRESSLVNMVVNYMLDHITENISIYDLVKYTGSNKTTISSVFKNTFGMSVMEYFINLKIDMAKKYLREDNYNISQISEILGYSGIHYFSRQFKKVTGMSPSEYSSSIKAMITNI